MMPTLSTTTKNTAFAVKLERRKSSQTTSNFRSPYCMRTNMHLLNLMDFKEGKLIAMN